MAVISGTERAPAISQRSRGRGPFRGAHYIVVYGLHGTLGFASGTGEATRVAQIVFLLRLEVKRVCYDPAKQSLLRHLVSRHPG